MRRAAHLFTLGFLVLWAIYAQVVEPFIMPGPVSVAVRREARAVESGGFSCADRLCNRGLSRIS